MCPDCGKKADRDVEFELNSGSELSIGIDHPRWSMSMGIPPSQLKDFRERYPNSVYNDKGHLLIKNRKDKLRQASERGFVELPDKKGDS